MSTTQTKKYYHFEDDLKAFPDAWCFIVYSPRGPGKTYSSLKYSLEKDIPIAYMKRTNDDVDFICNGKSDYDTSPYYPINRDTGSNVAARLIDNGIGGFWILDDVFCMEEPELELCGSGVYRRCISFYGVLQSNDADGEAYYDIFVCS